MIRPAAPRPNRPRIPGSETGTGVGPPELPPEEEDEVLPPDEVEVLPPEEVDVLPPEDVELLLVELEPPLLVEEEHLFLHLLQPLDPPLLKVSLETDAATGAATNAVIARARRACLLLVVAMLNFPC